MKLLIVTQGGVFQKVFCTGEAKVYIMDYDDLDDPYPNQDYLKDQFEFPDYDFPGDEPGKEPWPLSEYFRVANEVGAPSDTKLDARDERIYQRMKEFGL